MLAQTWLHRAMPRFVTVIRVADTPVGGAPAAEGPGTEQVDDFATASPALQGTPAWALADGALRVSVWCAATRRRRRRRRRRRLLFCVPSPGCRLSISIQRFLSAAYCKSLTHLALARRPRRPRAPQNVTRPQAAIRGNNGGRESSRSRAGDGVHGAGHTRDARHAIRRRYHRHAS